MLTQEKANMLEAFLAEDETRARTLVQMTAEDAVKKINAEGYDFTVEELAEFAKMMQQADTTGELDENALENVSGGSLKSFLRGFWDGWHGTRWYY